MSNTGNLSSTPKTLRTKQRASTNWLCWLLCAAFLAAVFPAQADEEEDQYFAVLDLVQKADALSTSGQFAKALAKYQQAQVALQAFHRDHLDWNPKVVTYRTKYLTEKIEFCSQKLSAAPAPATAANEKQPADAANKPAETRSGSEIKLLEAGNEPRKVLRLHPKPGDKQVVQMTLKMGMGMKIGEMENPAVKLPGMTMTLSSNVKSVSEQGDVTTELTMTDADITDEPGVMPQVVDAMKASAAKMKGLSGTAVTSERGVNKGIQIKTPQDADPQLRQVMDQMKDSLSNLGTPLPEEAVGSGAKWEAKIPLKSQGMIIDQVTTYDLASMEGEALTTRVTISQTAAQQKIESPTMPGLKIDLTSMTGSGNGQLQLNLGQLLPTTGDITSKSDLMMGVGAGQQRQTMKMSVDVSLHIESK
ncbi:MAG TPA: DUF6263 family protein [Candidatus Limnocylindrales bacterium]|nr:DUF6263 family protein [Candidatus Limnocylindrales bacterium]